MPKMQVIQNICMLGALITVTSLVVGQALYNYRKFAKKSKPVKLIHRRVIVEFKGNGWTR